MSAALTADLTNCFTTLDHGILERTLAALVPPERLGMETKIGEKIDLF
jgi:hypothetical protein